MEVDISHKRLTVGKVVNMHTCVTVCAYIMHSMHLNDCIELSRCLFTAEQQPCLC